MFGAAAAPHSFAPCSAAVLQRTSNNNEQDTILTQVINYTIPLLHFYAPQRPGRGCLPIVQRVMCARKRVTLITMHYDAGTDNGKG